MAYNQSPLKTFFILIIFLSFIFACNVIKKKDEKRTSGHTRAGNIQAAGTLKTEKNPSGLHVSKSNKYVKDQVIVKFKKGTNPKVISAATAV